MITKIKLKKKENNDNNNPLHDLQINICCCQFWMTNWFQSMKTLIANAINERILTKSHVNAMPMLSPSMGHPLASDWPGPISNH